MFPRLLFPDFRRLAALFLALLFCAGARAQVLLSIDVSQASNVTFTATGASPAGDDAETNSSAGITLEGFLSAASGLTWEGAGNLTAGTMTLPYGFAFAFSLASGSFAPGADLNIYNGAGEDQIFMVTQPAFSGFLTVDFSASAGLLPQAGWSGNILAGDGSAGGTVIGTYAVVPEPRSILLGLFGAGSVVLSRRRTAPAITLS
jgi:hypothetical protein